MVIRFSKKTFEYKKWRKMLNYFRRFFVGPIIALLISTNMFFWITPIFILGLFKFIFKFKFFDHLLDRIYQLTVSINEFILKDILGVHFIIQGDLKVEYSNNYIVLSNHFSWADTFIVQSILNKKIPPLKFLSKRQVNFIPFVGIISWAFNFPLLNRNKKYKDREKIIENLKLMQGKNLSFFIFPEGTRFTQKKAIDQNTPFKYLLKPKIGGFTTLLNTSIEYKNIIDLTILYPNQNINFWDFLSGNISHIYIYGRKLTNTPLKGSHQIKEWVYQKWKEKDNLLKSFRD